MKTEYRTDTCGDLRKKDSGKEVKLCGWVDTIRSYGKLHFVDLRDRYGKTQIVIKGKCDLKSEYCVRVEGNVQERKKGTANKDLETGDIEVVADKIEIFGKSKTPPIEIDDKKIASDDLRLEYRYLDLRRPVMQKSLAFRAKVAEAVREYYIKNGFIEIETPLLVKPTPEGARDYIVPSRVNPGKFYSLPQSPQLYKQILMISGFDRYFSLARCLRDEDLRQDRQPEHTQIDFEMSFVSGEDIMDFVENMYKFVFDKVLGVKLNNFKRFTYEEAIKKYKTDIIRRIRESLLFAGFMIILYLLIIKIRKDGSQNIICLARQKESMLIF
jgi:aspartyl-tRNA synthetase